ncbi:hypothetical protein [Photobacterium lutimaris]|uniref:Uncharacterized protein n=1 Tax=Photobacterium lutimaris TaxID=388278 RepID=A0A2T3J295_9GAMM|nr:hypothetical protein C9I99_05630 [Photobacterium lutimaris]
MSLQREVRLCPCCRVETYHVVVLVRKPSVYRNQNHSNMKEFISGFIKGWALGAFVASMDEFSHHFVCENCGEKTIEDS